MCYWLFVLFTFLYIVFDCCLFFFFFFFFSSRRRHTRLVSDWSSDVCSSDLSFFCPWMMVDDDVALIVGRELLGYPKKLGSIAWRREGDFIEGIASRRGEIGRASCRERV